MDLLKQVPKTVGKDIKVGKQLYTSGKRIYDAQAERSSIKKKFTAVGKTIKPEKIGKSVKFVGQAVSAGGQTIGLAGGLISTQPELAEIGLPMVALGATMTGAGKVIETSGDVVQKATNMGINIYKTGKRVYTAGKKKNKYKGVTDEHLPHFNISKAMYSGETPAGFTRDPSLCSAQSCAFRHTATGNIFIGWRGTELNKGFGTAVDDLVTDAHIALGTQNRTKRFKDSEDFFKKVKAKYPKAPIHLAGHSLGGSIGDHIANKFSDDVTLNVGFNAGTQPIKEAKRNLKGKGRSQGKSVQYTTMTDPLSTGIMLRDDVDLRITKRRKGLDPHTIDNFSPQTRYQGVQVMRKSKQPITTTFV